MTLFLARFSPFLAALLLLAAPRADADVTVSSTATTTTATITAKDPFGTRVTRKLTVSLQRHRYGSINGGSQSEDKNALLKSSITVKQVEADLKALGEEYARRFSTSKTMLESFDFKVSSGRTYHVNKANTEMPHSYPTAGSGVVSLTRGEFEAVKLVKLMEDARWSELTVTAAKARLGTLKTMLSKLEALEVRPKSLQVLGLKKVNLLQAAVPPVSEAASPVSEAASQ